MTFIPAGTDNKALYELKDSLKDLNKSTKFSS